MRENGRVDEDRCLKWDRKRVEAGKNSIPSTVGDTHSLIKQCKNRHFFMYALGEGGGGL